MKRKISGLFISAIMILFPSLVNAETLQEQINAASKGATIKLDKNYDEGVVIKKDQEVIIDLNGNNITSTGKDTFYVENGAKLEITGKGNVEAKSAGYASVFNNGTTNINGGTFVKDDTTGTWYAIVNHNTMTISNVIVKMNNYKMSSLIENGYYSFTGTSERESYITGYGVENPTLTIKSGTFDGGCNTVKNDENGILVIDGGVFKNTVQVTVKNWNDATINGGEFNVPTGKDKTTIFNGLYGKYGRGILKVTGGTFNAEYFVEGTALDTNKMVVTGGTMNVTKGFLNPRTDTKSESGKIENIVVSGVTSTMGIDKNIIADGYVQAKVGDTYKVLKESKVTLGKVTAGKVEVDKTTALEGEKVTLTLTPNNGYKLSSIKVVDTYNKEVSVTGGTFVMPNSDVTITVVFTKVEVEVPVISTNNDVKDVTIGVKNETKIEEVILDTIKNDTELASKVEGKEVTVKVDIAKVEASNVLNEVAKAMEEKAGKATIATYFDVTIGLKSEDGSINETISKLNEEIELVVLLPEELRNAKDGMTRKYYIVREHREDDKSQVDLLEATISEDGKYLVFKTDKFSTYAIAYEDIAQESASVENPKTLDGVMLYVTLGLVSIAIIGVSLNNLKRRNSR